jgi:DnaJ-class molecular chaperone
MRQCFYEILKLDRSATDSEIKKAYRKKALECHPDKNREDSKAQELFILVQQAYEVCSDQNLATLSL